MTSRRRCFLCAEKPPTALHLFPKDPISLSLWKQICNLKEYDDASRLLICSNHFTSEDYFEPNARTIGGRLRLKPGTFPLVAVPNTIEKSEHLVTTSLSTQKEKVITKLSDETTVNPEQSSVVLAAEPSATPSCSYEKEPDDWQPCTPKKRKFREARYFAEVTSPDFATPKRAKRAMMLAKQQIRQQHLRNRALEQRNRRLRKKVTSLQELINHLKQSNVLSEDAGDTMMEALPENIKQIISRKLKATKRKYSPELRSFALSLQFYSAKAYNYVRRTWQNLLPHPSTLRAWYSVVDGKPGFTAEAFKAISMRTKEKAVILNLVIDEMSIREQLIFDKNKFCGGVDMGTNIDHQNDTLQLAKNALVFMVVAVNGGWKVPVGYFLIKGLTGSERANLLTKCLELLHETGAVVHSLTFDGAAVNISMCRNLGADFNYGSTNFKPWIIHPVTKKKVYISFDACHMIKLVRNTLGDKGIIVDQENNKINWLHIKELNNIQLKEGLHLATKVTKKHIHFDSNRMNVRLAVQTLSESVSNALLYLQATNYLPVVFDDCTGTANFCLTFNNVFDLLNSRNKFSKRNCFNIPIDQKSCDHLKEQSLNFINYIKELKDPQGVKLITGSRKTGFLGLIINLINVFTYYSDVGGKIDYLLTFKFSQDYIETFFSAIRSRGGFNNNPNAKQFESAYKRLLIRNEIKLFDTSNCLADGIDILHVSSRRCKFLFPLADECETVSIDVFDHDYVNTMWTLNAYVENVVEYISGFVAKKLWKLQLCSICKKYLVSDKEYLLIRIKNRGKLIYPSQDVVNICRISENVFRQHINKISVANIKPILSNKIFSRCSNVTFNNDELLQHIKGQDYLDNHVSQMIKLIIDTFLNIRLFHEGNLASLKDDYVRTKYNRLILFKHQ